MIRLVMAAIAVVCLVGCASKGESVGAPEGVGQTGSASTWTGSVSTRSPLSDNTEVSTTSTIGRPGVVPAANAGFCWVTNISGSFRGAGEYAYVDYDANGYYRATVRSNSTFDGVTGVGPALSIKCKNLTDFVDAGTVANFTVSGHFAGGWPPNGGSNYGQVSASLTAGSLYPWAGLEGKAGDAGSATWMISAVDHSSDTAFARWAQYCPWGGSVDCQMKSDAWEVLWSGHSWNYSTTGNSASNNGDTQLITATGNECMIDGIWGAWTGTSSAKVETQGDGYWHLVTAKGAAPLGMGAYASCFSTTQTF